jgi:hypothetical protein
VRCRCFCVSTGRPPHPRRETTTTEMWEQRTSVRGRDVYVACSSVPIWRTKPLSVLPGPSSTKSSKPFHCHSFSSCSASLHAALDDAEACRSKSSCVRVHAHGALDRTCARCELNSRTRKCGHLLRRRWTRWPGRRAGGWSPATGRRRSPA